MKYVLGLDIGIASVGWAVVNLDRNRIEDLGVRAFSAAEDPKTRASLAEPRRLARSARRRLRRRAGRLLRAKQLFVQYGLVSNESIEEVFLTANDKPTPWQLRLDGLERVLSGEEFARALYHIAKHRGFKSNRKAEGENQKDKKDENGKVLQSIKQNQMILDDNGYRTVGEMFCLYEDFQTRKRNSNDSYKLCIDRSMLDHEIKELFHLQRRYGSQFASEQFEREFLEDFHWQLPFASGDRILSKVGYCTFEPDERRAPRNAFTTERFILLSDINKLSWYVGNEKFQPTSEQRHVIVDKAYSIKEIKYSQLRKFLNLPSDARFTGLAYTVRIEGKYEESKKCEDKKFCMLMGYHEIRGLCKDAEVWDRYADDADAIDAIAYILTFYKNEDDIREHMEKYGFPEALISEAISASGFSKVSNLSLKAMQKIIPYLEDGHVYSVACENAGYNHYRPDEVEERSVKLPPVDTEEVRNPVVLRALTQARKVVNAVIEKYGSPYHINIEMARDIGKSADERKKITQRIEDNRNVRQRDDEHFKEIYGMYPRTGDDRLKWRLYNEQGGKCAYSLKPIDIDTRFYEPGYVEIDHILPYSRSFDDSIANKVLVLSSENQHKRNRTPYEWFGSNQTRWDEFEAWVNGSLRDIRKRRNLLNKEYSEVERDDWMPRNLVDTQYIARSFSQYVRKHLKFSNEEDKLPVVCLNGRITSLLRGFWGLVKIREENDLHHAMDAVVIASVTPRLVKLITEYRKAMESNRWEKGAVWVDPETGEVTKTKYSFPLPWNGFRNEVIARLSENAAEEIGKLNLNSYDDKKDIKSVMVSRKPFRKVTGPIHLETIRSAREDEGKRVSVIRKDIKSLKIADLKRLYAPDTNEKLYAVIRERFNQFGDDGKKAFEEPLYKPTNTEGMQGPQVRKVKLVEVQPSGIEVRGGIADNGSMVRVDIFNKGGKYYLVPVYVSDFMEGCLPDRAIAQGKTWNDWPIMDESYEFKFSLYPYDLIRIVTKKEELFGYYRGCHRGTGALNINAPNKCDDMKGGIGARLALLIEKYEVDILGDYHLVKQEARRGMEDCGDLESREIEG